MNRRELLLASTSALAVSTAGCSELEEIFDDGATDPGQTDTDGTDADSDDTDGTDSDPTDPGWTTFRGDVSRTGRAQADAGPGESLSIAWELTGRDLVADVEDGDPEAFPSPITNHVSWPVLMDDLVLWTTVYEWSDDGDRERTIRLLAADAATGAIEWTDELGGDVLPDVPRWFAPEIDDGQVYVPNFLGGDLGLAVYNPETGTRAQELPLSLPALSTEFLVHDGTIYVVTTTDDEATMYAFDTDDGTEQWSVETATQPPNRIFASIAGDTLVYFARGDPPAFVAREIDGGDELWREPLDLPEGISTGRPAGLAPPVTGESGIFAAGGIDTMIRAEAAPLVSVDRDDGAEQFRYGPPGIPSEDSPRAAANPDLSPAEIEELPPFSAIYGLPVAVDDLIVATGYGDVDGSDGYEHCFAVDQDGSLAWAVESGITYTPVVAGDTIYLASTAGVEAISTDGEHRETLELEAEAESADRERMQPMFEQPPALGDGRLYVAASSGLVAIE